MRRFTVIIAVIAVTGLVASSGCTLELGELDDLFTITVGGDEDDPCLEAFDACVADPDISLADCAARLSECETEPDPEPDPTDRCYVELEVCLREADGSDPSDDRVRRCEEELRACLGEPDPDPDPSRFCYEEHEACMAEWEEGRGDDWAMLCEERLDACLRDIEPEPDPTLVCHEEYERCMAEWDETGDPDWARMCEDRFGDCLAGVVPDPEPDEICFPILDGCVADDGSIIDDGCVTAFTDCVAAIYPAGDGCAREVDACFRHGGDDRLCGAVEMFCR